jgi:hypothetical protein
MKARFTLVFTVVIVLLTLSASGSGFSPAIAANGPDTPVPEAGSPAEVWFNDYVSTSPLGGSYVSAAVDGKDANRSWVAYYSDVYGGLMVAHYVGAGLGNCNPNNAWLCEEVDKWPGESRGLYTSIAVFSDNNPDPAVNTMKVGVSYYNATLKTLKYAEYACATGTCAWTVQTVDSSPDASDDVGKYTSLDFDSMGTPNISYYVLDTISLTEKLEMVKHASFVGGGNGNCGDGNDWLCHVVDSSTGSLGMYTSLDVDWLDEVYISYYDGVNGALKYARLVGSGGNCGTDNAWRCRTVDVGLDADVGKFSAMHSCQNADDYLRIAYYDQTAGTLKYAYNIFTGGNCGEAGEWQCDVIDDVGANLPQVGIGIEVAPGNKPMVAYTEQTEDLSSFRLKIAQRAPEWSYSNCGGELWTRWWCQTLDDGSSGMQHGAYLGFALKPSGLAVVAYTELDTSYNVYNVKIAFEQALTSLPLVVK